MVPGTVIRGDAGLVVAVWIDRPTLAGATGQQGQQGAGAEETLHVGFSKYR
ncbi:hypothetical protein D3C84_1236480 [compost metagenome]